MATFREALIEAFEDVMGKIPARYIPESLSDEDLMEQLKNLYANRVEGKREKRPQLSTAPQRRSPYTLMAREYFGEGNTSKEDMAKKLGKTKARRERLMKAFDTIYDRGAEAYYTSGSRPNQTPESWGMARVFSVLFGGKSRIVDKDIVKKFRLPLLKV